MPLGFDVFCLFSSLFQYFIIQLVYLFFFLLFKVAEIFHLELCCGHFIAASCILLFYTIAPNLLFKLPKFTDINYISP